MMCASLHLVHTYRYLTTHSHIAIRLMISYSDLHLCYLRTALLSSKNFAWATVQCKMVQVICTKFFPITNILVPLTIDILYVV